MSTGTHKAFIKPLLDTIGCYRHSIKCREGPSNDSLRGSNHWLRQETPNAKMFVSACTVLADSYKSLFCSTWSRQVSWRKQVLSSPGHQCPQLPHLLTKQTFSAYSSCSHYISLRWEWTVPPHLHNFRTISVIGGKGAHGGWEFSQMGSSPIPLISECLVYPLVELWTLAADRLAPGHLKGHKLRAQEGNQLGFWSTELPGMNIVF